MEYTMGLVIGIFIGIWIGHYASKEEEREWFEDNDDWEY